MMVQKYSGSMEMCDYNHDMIQINDMNTNEVTLTFNNVWAQNDMPDQLRIFVQTNGVNVILDGQGSDDFQCLNTEGSDIDFEGENEFTVECYQESPDDPWLAVIDVVITDETIGNTNNVLHPCFPYNDPILESCSWQIIVPCRYDALCTDEPTSSSPTSSSTGIPTTLSPSSGSTENLTTDRSNATATVSPTSSSLNSVPTASPTITATFATNSTTTPTVNSDSNPTFSPIVFTATPTVAFAANPTDTQAIVTPSNITARPTATPTSDPTIAAMANPTASSTVRPATGEATHGEKGGQAVDTHFPWIGSIDCPKDILLVHHNGTTAYSSDTIQIVRQDRDFVTVKLKQTYTDSSLAIDSIYYQYKHSHFDNTCFEDQNIYGEDSVEITIQCTVNSQIALLELWVADDITKNVLSEGDKAAIPNCCHPTIAEGTPVTNFVIEVKCVTVCPKAIG